MAKEKVKDLDFTRLIAFAAMIVASLITIQLLAVILPSNYAAIVLDIERSTWPFTVQNLMWVVFFIGLGELWVRWQQTRLEELQIRRGYLPEDDETVLRPGDDLSPIYHRIYNSKYRSTSFLTRLIERCILHFNISHSVNQTSTLFNASLELFSHEIELRYNILKYIIWLIPSLGFIGTVIGIMLALNFAGDQANVQSSDMLYQVTGLLGVAFSTTLVGLVMAAILVFGQNMIQGFEEKLLNRAGQYCLDNLINRLYVE